MILERNLQHTQYEMQEDYIKVTSEEDRNSIRERAALFAYGRILSEKELDDLDKSRELGHKFFNDLHPELPYRINLGFGPFAEEIFGDRRGKYVFIHFDLYTNKASMCFVDMPKK